MFRVSTAIRVFLVYIGIFRMPLLAMHGLCHYDWMRRNKSWARVGEGSGNEADERVVRSSDSQRKCTARHRLKPTAQKVPSRLISRRIYSVVLLDGGKLMDDRVQSVTIQRLNAKLKEAGIAGMDAYTTRLEQNAGDLETFKDLLMEAHAALMFSHHGFAVTMRERPDLKVILNNETVYAEVKRFREKKQDRRDQEAMVKSEDLVAVGILPPMNPVLGNRLPIERLCVRTNMSRILQTCSCL